MTDFLSSLVCIAPLVALFVRGSRHEMFTPRPWRYEDFWLRHAPIYAALTYITRRALHPSFRRLFRLARPLWADQLEAVTR